MLFNSFQFLLFFPAVVMLYYFLPAKFRWLHLLISSCVFYMAFIPVYIFVLFALILLNYFAAIGIENAASKSRNAIMWTAIAGNLIFLGIFKYNYFFIYNANALFHLAGSKRYLYVWNIALPIGLSFHTFQALSYLIEVTRGNQRAERHIGIMALYVMFFPQIVAGPIERPQNMLHQFREKHLLNYTNVIDGVKLMAYGIFKKAVVADRLALVLDPIFNDPGKYCATNVALAVLLYGLQIYCDFSAYSDIALGAAKVLGIKLMVNFNRPFSSKSITEFWRRWHISLSTWFYDYVFQPLATTTRRWAASGIVISLMVTFILAGLWHGAAWKFVIFGYLQGAAIVLEYLSRNFRKKIDTSLPSSLSTFVSRAYVYVFMCCSWVFFRAPNSKTAFSIFRKFPNLIKDMSGHIKEHSSMFGRILKPDYIVFLSTSLLILYAISYMKNNPLAAKRFHAQSRFLKWGLYYLLLSLIFFEGVFTNKQFIYFQF